jgi:CheY-like chemotaxis protein
MAKSAPVVLVVDDDPDVLLIASTILSDAGYTVLEAAEGAEALSILQAHPEIDLLFTDVVMPGDVDGFELAHRAKQSRPDLRVVYTSGYIKNLPWGEKGIGYGPLLAKPWRQNELLHHIRGAFDGGGSAEPARC